MTQAIKSRAIRMPNGASFPALGQGTWMMGQDPARLAQEEQAIRCGIDLGLSLIDTAEMYGDGAAESLVGRAIAGRRHEVFVVTKVLPSHGRRRAVIAAAEASLRRLGIGQIDLYLLHWPGSVPLEETIGAFETLRETGKIAAWGVSNFDTAEMAEVQRIATSCQTNQILYNLSRRGPEFDLVPWCAEHGMPVMAYSPLEQGRLFPNAALAGIARRHAATEAQIALAWVLARLGIIAIPKAGSVAHATENAGARDIALTAQDLAELAAAFPAPKRRQSLAML